jgi:hypothetical protein
MLTAPWIEAVIYVEALGFEAAAKVPGFKAAAEATRVDAAEVQIMQVGVTSCV